MLRTLALATALLVLVLGGAAVSAQSAAPAASNLSEMGYPELTIVAKGDHFEAPEAVEAGRYLLIASNPEGQPGTEVSLTLLPEGETLDGTLAAFASGDIPAWLFETTFLGGPIMPRDLHGKEQRAVVDLTPGDWIVWSPGNPTPAPRLLTVTGDAAAVATAADPEADVEVELQEYAFTMPEEIPAGPRVWQVTNVGTQPHFIELVKTPEPVTMEQMTAILFGDGGATPAPGAPNPDEFFGAGGLATMSVGTTGWIELDLEPGYYVAMCFVPDAASGMPHAMMGMLGFFTVVADGTTSAA
jgi:hypothetical protein